MKFVELEIQYSMDNKSPENKKGESCERITPVQCLLPEGKNKS
jgi:hypothetical protein